MATLPCADGGGSINNSVNQNTDNKPYVAPELCVGSWTLTNQNPDTCETNDQRRQESYVAEMININGAPLNVFKLLGIHEQGNGSLLNKGKLLSSLTYPGFPITGLNNGGTWKSYENGSEVLSAYLGVDFGVKTLFNGDSKYNPSKPKFTKVGAVKITQSNDPFEFASQIKVEYAAGDVQLFSPIFTGTGNGFLKFITAQQNAMQGKFFITAISSIEFTVQFLADSTYIPLTNAIVGKDYTSSYINFKLEEGTIPFTVGDSFIVNAEYSWTRIGMFNAVQSPDPIIFKFQTPILVKAIRIIPTLFNGSGNWGVKEFDVLEDAPSTINDIQDLFFNENRDRDYSKNPILVKAQYNPTDSVSDLSRFGISILDQYSFTTSFATIVQALGRPPVVGDIIELIPELQYDHNLKPIRKFLEITDTAWASEGFSTHWKPTVIKFSAQPAIPSQETRDIFGTLDTQKYLLADEVLSGSAGQQLDTTPLSQLEEIIKGAANAVPETGDNALRDVQMSVMPPPSPKVNAKGNPEPVKFTNLQNIYVEDGLPKNGEPYTEGYALPEIIGLADGTYFRLNYAEHLNLPSRLYRFSLLKNRWIYLETDRRSTYGSHKPSAKAVLNSSSQQSLKSNI